jgi:hypothetical protein
MSMVSGSSRSSTSGPVGDPTGVLVLAALAGLGWAAYLFVPTMGAMAWELVLHVLREPFQPGSHTLHTMLCDSLVGLVLGLLIGLFRYRFRIRGEVVDSIADAMWKPDAIALGKLGMMASHFVFHAGCGAISGLAIGAIGMIQAPDLVWGDQTALSTGTAVANLLMQYGFFGGSGGGAGGAGSPDASPFLALLVVLLVGLILVLLASLLSAIGFAVLGRAMLSGAANSFSRNLGTCIVLFLTRWWDRYRVSVVPRFPPLDFDRELEEFNRLVPPEDCYPLNYYWDFLRARGLPLNVKTVIENLPAFEEETQRRSHRNSPRVVRSFVGRLQYELKRRDPSQYPADALPDHLCSSGWFGRAVRKATFVGLTVGAMNVLLSMACLIALRAGITEGPASP